MLRAKEDARSLISFRQKRPYDGINNKDVLLLLFGLIRININNKKMECAHCHNPQAGNLEPITQRAFCNAECQRALYVKGGIFDIVATRKRDVPRDVVYKLLKEDTTTNDIYEYQNLPKRLVLSLCLMHNEHIPFSKDHIDKVYNFFFDVSNAQALRNTFFWHQDKLKEECIHLSSLIHSEEEPCEEIFLRLYAMGTFVPNNHVMQSFGNWYDAEAYDVCAVFLKDQALNLHSNDVDMLDIIYTAISQSGSDTFLRILTNEQIHINIIYSLIEGITTDEPFSDDDDLNLAYTIFGIIIVDERLINTIPVELANMAFDFSVNISDLNWIQYIILNLNPSKENVTNYIRSLLDNIQAASEPYLSELYEILNKLLLTNKIELDGIAIYEYNMKTYDILIRYQRARERGQGESSRKYTRMGKRL